MADNKTQQTAASVDEFLASVEDETRREDARTLLELMREVTGEEAVMWGPSIVGFGHQQMVYDRGREVDWFHVGFSPRKQSLTLYIMDGFDEYEGLLSRLGKHSTGKSCLYVKRLDDVDTEVLTDLIGKSVAQVRSMAD